MWQSFSARLSALARALPFKSGASCDRVLLIMVLALSAYGLVMVYSASYIFSQERFEDGLYYFRRHVFFLGLGLGCLVFFRYFNYQLLQKIALPLFLASVGLVAMTLVPGLGHRAGGAARWLNLGPVTIQPVEFAKLSFVLYMAARLSRAQQDWDKITTGFLFHLWPAFLFVGFCMLQPDFGSSALIIFVCAAMLFMSGVRLRFLAGSAAVILPALAAVMIAAPYRRARLLTFLDPWADPHGAGFQIVQSFIAFYRGGFFGVGLGNSKAKIFYLPEAHNDFILSVVGEELGFLGIAILTLLFLLLVYRMIKVSAKSNHRFAALLAGGMGVLIGLEVFWHASIVLGLLPTKGMNLPFISSGGSSIICALAITGILLNISAQTKAENAEL